MLRFLFFDICNEIIDVVIIVENVFLRDGFSCRRILKWEGGKLFFIVFLVSRVWELGEVVVI